MHHLNALAGIVLILATGQAAAKASDVPTTARWQCMDWIIDLQPGNATVSYNKGSVNLPIVLDTKPGLVMAGRMDDRPIYQILVLDLEKSTFAVTEVSTIAAPITKVHKCNRTTVTSRP